MDLRSIFITNGVGIVILLVLRYVSRAKSLQQRTEDKIFTFMVFGVMVACFMEALSYAIDGKVFFGACFLNYVANTYLFSVNLLLPFCVLAYVDLGLYGDSSHIWGNYKPQIIIGIIMFLANVTNFFVPVTYVISEDNVYSRCPFSYVYYFVILYYCISAIVVTKQYERKNGAKTFFSIQVFLMPILIGAGLQFMFYGLSLAWLSAAVGLTGLFMMQQNELAYIDGLVDTYNRLYLNQILASWVSKELDFGGVMLDLDDFKGINDTYGHSEGDAALKTVARALKDARQNGELVFRYAGDEFIVLCMGESTDRLDAYMGRVNALLNESNRERGSYRLSVSYGVTRFGEGGIDSFMKDMDDRMYQMKADHHVRRS